MLKEVEYDPDGRDALLHALNLMSDTLLEQMKIDDALGAIFEDSSSRKEINTLTSFAEEVLEKGIQRSRDKNTATMGHRGKRLSEVRALTEAFIKAETPDTELLTRIRELVAN